MSRSIAVALVVSLAVIAVIVALAPAGLSAQEVGQTKEIYPGIWLKNLGEGPTDIPGFEKVRIVEYTMEPGAYQPPEKMESPMFCTVLRGQVTGKVDGVKMMYKAGDSYTCRVGQTLEGKNTSSEPYIERIHKLIPPERR